MRRVVNRRGVQCCSVRNGLGTIFRESTSMRSCCRLIGLVVFSNRSRSGRLGQIGQSHQSPGSTMGSLNFNLLEQLTFYGSYHNNKWNQLIHFIFVPAIVWSLAVWLVYTGPLVSLPLENLAWLPPWASRIAEINGAFLLSAAYSLYYLGLEPVAGATWSACVGVPIWLGATAFRYMVPGAWKWALLVHVFSWYMQIHPGHAVLEGRKPALLDSLVQALTLAPLFVWFELLFLVGYRPQLYAQLQKNVVANVAKFRAQGKVATE
eukprot:GHUV01007035.1.p1 GENE.GHUV01007035.1~~GHUV01007035.1.p1  ORF type:complete len:264 (+),score=40.52 GHUV01007035.1:2-793(+)